MVEVDTITLILAIYGAVLSTILGVFKIVQYLLESRPRLKVTVKVGVRQNAGGLNVELAVNPGYKLNELGDTPTHFVVEIANIGKRPVTVSKAGLRLSGHKSLNFINTQDKLPKKLEEGESHTIRRGLDELKNDLRTKIPNHKPKHVFVIDQTGKEYTSKKFNTIMKNLLKYDEK